MRCSSASLASYFRSQHGAPTFGLAAAALKLLFQFGGVALINHQAVVVKQFFAGLHGAQGFDEDPAVNVLGFAVGLAAVVDPARHVAAHFAVDGARLIDMKVKRVVGVGRVVRMAAQRLAPADDFALYSITTSPLRSVVSA